MEVHGFEWDRGNTEKCQIHGLSITEIESVFHNNPFIALNNKHFTHEERLHAIGVTNKGKHAFVVFTIRKRLTEKLIRPISARHMHKDEIDHYEKQIKT